MGRKFIPDEASTYYPPRARWYSVFFYLGNAVRRRLSLDRLVLPREIKLLEMAAGFFVPVLAVHLRGPKLWAQIALAVWVMLFLFYVVALGYPAANIAFGLMISIHSTGFIYYSNPLLARESFPTRIAITVLALIAIMLLFYMPARNVIQQHWLSPLRLNGQVIVVQRQFQPHAVQRGEWVAYTFDQEAVGNNYHGGTVWLRNGMSLGPVLALPGDVVTFSTNSFFVNDVRYPNLPHMPLKGGLTVRENHWFIWPNLDISGHGDVGEERVASALLGLADVDQTNFFGKPFHRWFGRKQTLP